MEILPVIGPLERADLRAAEPAVEGEEDHQLGRRIAVGGRLEEGADLLVGEDGLRPRSSARELVDLDELDEHRISSFRASLRQRLEASTCIVGSPARCNDRLAIERRVWRDGEVDP